MPSKRLATFGLLAAILTVGSAFRLTNIGFGLPGMYDPDEPIFMIVALKMLSQGTLNPGWFGHPGSTTITLIAAIDAAVAYAGIVMGDYANPVAFAKAAYADPAMLFLPARLAMALFGMLCVALTYLVGRRLHGRAAGLMAAALLALNGLHISWSQVIRTDIMASAFMLASLLFALRVAEQGRARDYGWAGIFAGFAIATKWPAATIVVAIIGAYAWRRTRGEFRLLVFAGAATLGGVFIASPYIFLDWPTVIANATGEMKPGHLTQSGRGLFGNLGFYTKQALWSSMGWVGLAAVAIGLVVSVRQNRLALYTSIPAAAAFLLLISSQNMVWTRWVLPALPFLCVAAGAAFAAGISVLSGRVQPGMRNALVAALGTLLLAPSVAGAVNQQRERANDTRTAALRWVEANIPAGSTVVYEHLELGIRDRPWRILFPVGRAGCIDGVAALRGGVDFDQFQELRKGNAIVDLGNVAANRIEGCRADYYVLTYYDRYRAEAADYPKEMATYEAVIGPGRTAALFRPVAGQSGGPVVRIVTTKTP